MTAQAVLASGNDPQLFARLLGWKLRWWVLGMPAGIGLATLRSCIKLWIGFPPSLSGVYSAGNGPVMRSVILGVLLGKQPEVLRKYVRAATVITHTDPLAEQGALVVALAAHISAESQGQITAADFQSSVAKWNQLGMLTDASVKLIAEVVAHIDKPSQTFLRDVLWLDAGVTGYINHTVSAALHIWLRSPQDFRHAVSIAVDCGGDTDTLAAAVGGIVGAATGSAAIPPHWLNDLWEYPRTVKWMRQLARVLTGDLDRPVRQVPVNVPAVVIRNVCFLLIVLCHGLRRLAPPY